MDSASPSLFSLLLGPLKARDFNPHFPETYPPEDFSFVAGLLKALEIDLENGAAAHHTSDKQQWLTIVVERLIPPTHEGGSSIYETSSWPLPDQPWIDQPNADPREALIARLIHLGANPWETVQKQGKIGEHLGLNVAGALLAQGHTRLFSLCMQLPQFSVKEIEQTCPSYNRGEKIGRTYLQEAVFQNSNELTNRLIQMGASMNESLFHARSPNMISLLLENGVSVAEKKSGKSLTTWWLENFEAKTARVLIKAVEGMLRPMERFEQASSKNSWQTVKDALDAMPGWEEMTQTVGSAQVRLPLALLMRSKRDKNIDQINHALRMEAKAPFDDRIVADGISEKTLARLTLDRLISSKVKPIQVQTQLAEKMKSILGRIGSDVGMETVLFSETQQFISCGIAFRNTSCGSNIARRAAAAKRIIANETDGYADRCFYKRTLDDLNTINLAVRMIIRNGEAKNISEECYEHIVGYKRTVADITSLGKLDNRKTWLDRLEKQHPDRLDEVASGAMALLHFQISSGLSYYGSFLTNKDVWGADVRRIENLLQRGARLDITHEQAIQFQEAANSSAAPSNVGGMQDVIRFAQGLVSIVAKQSITDATAPVSASYGPSKRL